MSKLENITIDGVEYKVSDLTPIQQRLVTLYEQCIEEKEDCQDGILLMNAAMYGISQDLIKSITDSNKPTENTTESVVE